MGNTPTIEKEPLQLPTLVTWRGDDVLKTYEHQRIFLLFCSC